jgi:hypothetical protein
MASDRARRVDVPDSILETDTLGHPSYTCAFELASPANDARSAHEWLRAILEGAPGPLRRFVVAGWIAVLRLQLAPRPSSDHVLGWKVLLDTPQETVLGVEGPTLSAHQVVQVHESRIVHVTFVRYNRPVARLLWTVAAPIHVRVIPYLMDRARLTR